MDRIKTIRFVAGLLTAVGVLGARAWQADPALPADAVDLASVPLRLGEYSGRDLSISERVLEQLQTDGLLVREYLGSDEIPIWLLVDYHRTQQTASTVHSPRVCYPGTGWRVTNVTRSTMPGTDRRVCWLELENGGYRRLAGYWYVSRWGDASNEFALKADIVRSALARRPSDAATVRVSAPILDDDVDDARSRISNFLAIAEPHLQRELPFSEAR